MGRIRAEAETTITFNEEETIASVYSISPVFQRKMERLKVLPYRVAGDEEGGVGMFYKVPKGWIKIRKPREMSDEQRQAVGDRLRGYRK